MSFYDFQIIHISDFSFLHLIGVYVTFIISECSNYSVRKRMQKHICISANIFSFFYIAKNPALNPDHRNDECPYICRFQKLCTTYQESLNVYLSPLRY